LSKYDNLRGKKNPLKFGNFGTFKNINKNRLYEFALDFWGGHQMVKKFTQKEKAKLLS
jgi:hypothetical protein